MNRFQLKKISKNVVASLKADVEYLADDKLEGRESGTNGEQLAFIVLCFYLVFPKTF